jgi:hypothetical protein
MRSDRNLALPAVRQDVVPTGVLVHAAATAPDLNGVVPVVMAPVVMAPVVTAPVVTAPVVTARGAVPAVQGPVIEVVMAPVLDVMGPDEMVDPVVVPVVQAPVIVVAMALVPGETAAPNVAAVTEFPGQVYRVSGAVDPMAADPGADRDEVVRWGPPRCSLRLPAMA